MRSLFVVQLHNCVRLFVTPWTAAHQASPSLTISWSLPKFMSIELVMPFNHLIVCCLLPLIFPSIRVFSSEIILCIRWPKYWSFNFNISPSNEYSRLISYKTDWFDLLGVQGTLRSLLQHHSSKASVLWCSAFFSCSPALTTVPDHWEDQSLDYMDLCWRSDVSALQHTVQVCHSFPAKKQSSSDFMAAVTICSDF